MPGDTYTPYEIPPVVGLRRVYYCFLLLQMGNLGLIIRSKDLADKYVANWQAHVENSVEYKGK